MTNKCNAEEVRKYLDEKIDETFLHFHRQHMTESGDITPEQVLSLAKITRDLAELIAEQVNQNIEIY